MNVYDRDLQDLMIFAKWACQLFGSYNSSVAVRDYNSDSLLVFVFGKGWEPQLRDAKDSKYNRMFDVALSIPDNSQNLFKYQKEFLKWGFFIVAQEKNKAFFEKLDEFTFEGNVFSSCSSLLEHYGKDPDEFYEMYSGSIPILEAAFQFVQTSRSSREGASVHASSVFKDRV